MSLAQKVSANVEARIWAASYGLKREAFRVAEISVIKRPNISRLEAGTHVPGILLIECLAESLQVKISDLIAD